MKPRFFTIRNLLLILVAVGIFGGLAYWLHEGMPLPGQTVPSTRGKIVFVSDRNGHSDLYMMNGADGSNVVPLTKDDAEDTQPDFSPNGKEIAFVSTKRGGQNNVVPQIYVCDAMPGRRPVPLTNTSSTKDAPRFVDKEKVIFLDAGKLTEHTIPTQDDHAVFPEPDMKRLLSEFVSAGGLRQVIPIAGGERFAMVMNMERGQVLLLYQHDDANPENLILAALGAAERIYIAPTSGGGFAAAFTGGGPRPQAVPILTPEILKQLDASGLTPPAPNFPVDETINILALFDEGGSPKAGNPLPFAVDELSVSPDGKNILVALSEGQEQTGLVLFTPEEKKATQLTDKQAHHISFSPDGTQVAFVADKDIFVMPTTGGEPKNLTQGNGSNSHPIWSPASE